MNKYLAVFAFIAVIAFVRCDSSEELLEGVKSKHLKSILKEKSGSLDAGLEKLEEKCPGVTEKLKDAVKSFVECDDKVDDSLTICEAIQSSALNCTAPLLKVVDGCLPERSRGLPTLGLKSLLSVADHLCKQKGESIFELLNPCLWEDIDEESNEQSNECEEKAKASINKFKQQPPSPSDICSAVTGLRGCVSKRVSDSCKNAKTKTSFLGVFDAAVAPCSTINEV